MSTRIPAALAAPGPQVTSTLQTNKTSIAARIIVHQDGKETLPNGEPLHSHPVVKSRAQHSTFALHDACEIGDLLFVKASYSQPTNDTQPRNTILDPSATNKRDLYSQTPLHLAILNGRYEIAKVLLKNGADPTLLLEGMTQLQVLLTLIGSFPQYQIPMLQPTPALLQQTVDNLLVVVSENGTRSPRLPTPHDLITDNRFAQFQSYGIRMASLLLEVLEPTPREVYKRDDNGHTIFHICAQYDLVEPFILFVDRLFTNVTLPSGARLTDKNLTHEEQYLLVRKRETFCAQIVSQDAQKRTIFHYCAQYRSFHLLGHIYNFIEKNIQYFPPVGIKPLSQAQNSKGLYSAKDAYHRTPLHYAHYYAAPFYSRPKAHTLADVIGNYYHTVSGSSSTIDEEIAQHECIQGNETSDIYLENRRKFDQDPIVQKLVEIDSKIQDNIAQGIAGWTNLQHIIGNATSCDLYKRTPYQCGVFNQPIQGAHNSGTIIPINPNGTPDNSMNNDVQAKMKPTLIAWSPRCFEHHTAPKISRRDEAPPPENVRRLQVLLNFTDGILRSNEFNHRVSQTDILALNHTFYSTLIEQLNQRVTTGQNQTNPKAEFQTMIKGLDVDTQTCSSSVLRVGDINTLPSLTQQDNSIPQLITNTPIIPQNILHWNHRASRATFSDVLRCHDFGYITRLMSITENVPEQDDWGSTTSDAIDILHRDLHISVPMITSLPLNNIVTSYNTAMDFYFKVLDRAKETALLPPHDMTNNNNTMNSPANTVALIKKRNQGFAPLSQLTQNILYRERSLLNLNLGFANLQLPQYTNILGQNESEIATKNDPNDQHAQDILALSGSYLGDAHELYDSALFPLQLQRVRELNHTTNVYNWRTRLTPAIYTNSIIQSSSLVGVVYHYPNHAIIQDSIDPATGLCMTEQMGDDNGEILLQRTRTSSYAGELSTTTPAPFITRYGPPAIPLRHLDDDTAVSAFSWFAALYAGGTVIDAVKRVVQGQYKNAFCAVRPPGHHSGPLGLVSSDETIGDSHGFCLLNNIAIGAAYAKAMFPDIIKRVAIVDFDVHHGNGTESIVEKLQPRRVQKTIQLAHNPQFGTLDRVCLSRQVFSPWYDSQDIDEVLFASVHGYHRSGGGDQFYPGTGSTTEGLLETLIDQNKDPYRIIAQSVELTEEEKIQFFSNSFTSRTSAVTLLNRYMENRDRSAKSGEPKKPYVSPILVDIFKGDEEQALDFVRNNRSFHSQSRQVQAGLTELLQNQPHLLQPNDLSQFNQQPLPTQSIYPGDLPTDLPLHFALDNRPNRILNAGLGKGTKKEWRKVWQHSIIPGLVAHKPDLIMISAGFDAHHRDKINGGHVCIDEDDYYWITKQLMKVANLCCEGRIVSCLEGGYRIHCGLVSPFARSVAAHVRALHEGGNDPWTPEDVDVEIKIADEEKEIHQAMAAVNESELIRRHIEDQCKLKFGDAASTAAILSNSQFNTTNIVQSLQEQQVSYNYQQDSQDQPQQQQQQQQPQTDLDGLDDSNIITSPSGGRSQRQRSTTPINLAALKKYEAQLAAKKKQKTDNMTDGTETQKDEQIEQIVQLNSDGGN